MNIEKRFEPKIGTKEKQEATPQQLLVMGEKLQISLRKKMEETREKIKTLETAPESRDKLEAQLKGMEGLSEKLDESVQKGNLENLKMIFERLKNFGREAEPAKKETAEKDNKDWKEWLEKRGGELAGEEKK